MALSLESEFGRKPLAVPLVPLCSRSFSEMRMRFGKKISSHSFLGVEFVKILKMKKNNKSTKYAQNGLLNLVYPSLKLK